MIDTKLRQTSGRTGVVRDVGSVVLERTRLVLREFKVKVYWHLRRLCLNDASMRTVHREYRKRFSTSLSDWVKYHQREVLYGQCQWMGTLAWKNPLDAWIYQEILHEVRPDVVVEIGSAAGGSTLFLAHILELLGRGIVVSVDIDRSSFNVSHERIVTITGDSAASDTVQQVSELCRDKSVIVIHDGGHRKEEVLRDLALYSPLVTVGSYLIVEDGIVDVVRLSDRTLAEDGPLAATEHFLRETPNFEADHSRERYVLTYNPRGYLRRTSSM